MLRRWSHFSVIPLVWALFASTFSSSSFSEDIEFVDVAVGWIHSCVLDENGRVWCWGPEVFNGQDMDSIVPMPVVTPDKITAIFAGRTGTCGITASGKAHCWGLNFEETLRLKRWEFRSKPFQIEGLPPVSQIAIGFIHYCALSISADVYCWGNNPAGELGDGTNLERAAPLKVKGIGKVISIDAGVNNTCVVEAGGNVKCWGTDNPGGSEGYAIASNVPESVPVIEGITDIANGRNYVCGLQQGGRVFCWGSPHAVPFIENARYRLDNAPGRGATVTLIETEHQAIQVEVSLFAGCVVYENGTLSCWTFRDREPRLDTRHMNVRKVSLAPSDLGCVLLVDGSVYCWDEDLGYRKISVPAE